jgi:polysaccharide pyruvyl transferase WcaK-like protein
MLIEIRKANFLNKGAELMLYAALEKMKEAYPDAKFAMAPHPMAAPFEKRIKLGLYQKPDIWLYGFQWGRLFNWVPKVIREMYGVVLDKEIDVVLDAAGFAYSDQWGERASVGLASSCKSWKKNNAKVILLPQAFGPFENAVIRKSMKTVVDHADLVFAREQKSYDYLINAAGEQSSIRLSPDFTNLITGVLPDDFDSKNNRFCLVPNYRMIDKTPKKQSEAYLPFMIECAKYLVEKRIKAFILVHEGEKDLKLSEEINKAVHYVLPVIKETDALKIKGILGACDGTIGSRFHGLVSALSQGVPALATGWSHKYQLLFNDYGFPEGLLDVNCTQAELHQKVDLIVDPQSTKNIKQQIQKNAERLKQQSQQMWQQVYDVIADK